MNLMQHIPILPVVIPLLAGAFILLIKDHKRPYKITISLISIALQIAVSIKLLSLVSDKSVHSWTNNVGVYLLGDWPAPFGIVAVVDKLTVILLLLTSLLGLCTWIYSTAKWDRMGVHFHSLFQFLLMGLNGAFLTGDLFNLFVFFEVLLVASYGLMLHGSGKDRIASGLHYIAVNLVASFLLLIALAIIYGLTGTLNMADLAVKVQVLSGSDRNLFEAGAALLGMAFLIKAAAWPLNFWLPSTYADACAPVGAMFAIMTKVGIYALLRIGSLLVPTVSPAAFGGTWMFAIGVATIIFAAIGLLASYQLERQAGFGIILSSGILLTTLGSPGVLLTGPALFYMVVSVFALGAFFMLIEMISRTQSFGADVIAISQEMFDLDDPESPDETDDVVGIAIPAAMAFLGMTFFTCALLIVGMPPLSGFIAKFAILTTALQAKEILIPSIYSWIVVVSIIVSGFAGLIALSRTGIRLFWSNDDINTPRLRIIEAGPVALLIVFCIALTIWAKPVMSYMNKTALYLDKPNLYIEAVIKQSSSQNSKVRQ